jgi:hypothetical protein
MTKRDVQTPFGVYGSRYPGIYFQDPALKTRSRGKLNLKKWEKRHTLVPAFSHPKTVMQKKVKSRC